MRDIPYLIILLLIIQIQSDDPLDNTIVCHERCQTCSTFATTDSQECDTCVATATVKYPNELIYPVEGEKNCNADHERPDHYISGGILKKCPNHCYQCNDENSCLSCERGYSLNGVTCDKCSEDKYTLITDALEYCQASHKNFYHCKLKYTTCSNIVVNEVDVECPKEHPLLRTDEKECVLENLAECLDCLISNHIAKTQWLNKVIDFTPFNCWFIEYALNSKGDLILLGYQFKSQSADRYYYGFRQNGRPLFYNHETNNYEYTKTMYIPNFFYKYESEMIKINLYDGDDDKDHFLSVAYADFSIEITDIENERIYNTHGGPINENYYWTSLYFSIFELQNEPKVYIFCYIKNLDGDYTQSYLYLNKIKFFNPDINQANSYQKILSTEIKDELKVMPTKKS